MSDETTITRQPKRMLADLRATTANSSRWHLLTRALLDAFHRGSGPPPVRTTTAALRTERSPTDNRARYRASGRAELHPPDGPPCAPHRYSAPRSSRCLGISRARPTAG